MKEVSIGFCGFGGQGIILSAVVLGTTAVAKDGLYVVETQSYGSEARGGQCQAGLIISKNPINSLGGAGKDILVAMSQAAFDRYVSSLRPGGLLVIDPDMVTTSRLPGKEVRVMEIPATKTAIRLGNRICANMVILGFLQGLTGIVSKEGLTEAVRETVPERYLDLNLRAIEEGIRLSGAQVPRAEESGGSPEAPPMESDGGLREDKAAPMAIHIDEALCKGCGLCIHYCPRGVLAMTGKVNVKGFAVAGPLNEEKCTKCKMCEINCPDLAISIGDGQSAPPSH
jgi:2-oxoglutarate ferredoxin oxidoreductase subunit gamma